jgi:hypothetical protein
MEARRGSINANLRINKRGCVLVYLVKGKRGRRHWLRKGEGREARADTAPRRQSRWLAGWLAEWMEVC